MSNDPRLKLSPDELACLGRMLSDAPGDPADIPMAHHLIARGFVQAEKVGEVVHVSVTPLGHDALKQAEERKNEVCCVCGQPEDMSQAPGKMEPVRELRPYGPGGQPICHHCAKSTPALRRTAMEAMAQKITEAGPIIVMGDGAPRAPTAKELEQFDEHTSDGRDVEIDGPIEIDHVILVCNGCKGLRKFEFDPVLKGADEFITYMKTNIKACGCGADTCDIRAHVRNAKDPTS